VTALASALKAARESKGWSQRRLAEEVTSSGRELSSAYVGLIEAGHRIPTEAVVRAVARVLERDADEWTKLRSEAESERRLVELARHVDPTVLAKGRERTKDFLARHGTTPMVALNGRDEALGATAESPELDASAEVAAAAAAAWQWASGRPRRGRRYELATQLFELVADLDAGELQRVIGYTEAVRENRRPVA
jgi:transcriptional regulator with XRE-family HTH domain